MKTLYIIGNGFDLHHGLPTGYSDFHQYVCEHNTDLENMLDQYFVFKTNKDHLWTDFEEDLSSFEHHSFFTEHCQADITDDHFKPSDTYDLADSIDQEGEDLVSSIKTAVEDWIGSIDISSAKPIIDLQKNANYITFNYTRTLEDVYRIAEKQIIHIHGDGDLIIGHNRNKKPEPDTDLDEDGNSNRTLFSDAQAMAQTPFYQLIKPVKELIKQNEQMFNATVQTQNIYVLGHSLNRIDLPYFQEIIRRSPDARWWVSYYGAKERQTHIKTLVGLGISLSAIRLFQLSNLNMPD